MQQPPPDEGADADHEAVVNPPLYQLQLYVAGASDNSVRAITNLKYLCDTYLPGQYSLEIIDVHQQKHVAEQQQLIALPMLVKRSPLPERKLIGNMADTQKVLTGLGIC